MPPKSRAKRKAENAGRRSVEVRKQQRGSLPSPQSAAKAAVVSLEDRESEVPSSLSVSPSNLKPSMDDTVVGGSLGPASSSVDTLALEVSLSFGEDQASVEAIGSELACPSESQSTASSMEGLRFEGEEASLSLGNDQASMEATESDPTNTLTSQEIMKKFVEEWLQAMGKDDVKSIAIFLCYQLVDMFSYTETKAAEYAAQMINRSDRTVRRWRTSLIENNGEFPEAQHGKYLRSCVWNDEDEDLNKKATEYVRSNAAVKGRPNLTSIDFCCWVNNSLLPNSTLEPNSKNIPLACDSVSVENIQNHFRKVRHYMFCYLEGLTPGKELDKRLKMYKTAVKSHRRIGMNE